MWIFIIIVVTLVVGYLLVPRPNANVSPGQVEAPTAEEGRPIPVLFGSRVIRGPNLVWYGNATADSIPLQTGNTGYSYSLDFHMVLCHAPIDILAEILVADRKVALRDWGGTFPPVQVISGMENGSYLIDSPNLFGGLGREGGIAGRIDYLSGDDSQIQHPDLPDAIGNPLVPAFRGTVGIVAFEMGIGTTPYMKDWAFYAIRYSSTWLSDISGIGLTEVPFSGNDPFWDDVIALVHFDAVAFDGTNYFWEDAKTGNKWGKTTGTFNGNLDTTDKKFGAGSSRGGFPGDPVDGRTDNEAAFNAIWIFPSGEDFTLECSMLRDQVASVADSYFLGQNGVSGEMCFISRSDGSIEWSAYVAPYFVRLVSPPGTIVAGNWYHIAYCRASGIGRLFVNGIKVAQLADPTNYAYQTGWVLNGTAFGPSTYTLLDEFRATRAARYIENFIPNLGFDTSNPVHVDMNPAHIIRECLLDSNWGMGYTEDDIDNTSFTESAQTLYDEGLGMSLLWDTESTIEDFINTVCKHINASIYVNRYTGKFVLKLIRQDYDADILPVLNTSNVTSISDYQRLQFGELTNAVTVSYWDKLIRNTATVTVQDIAAVAMQGSQITTTVKYDGFTNSAIASKIAQRDLRALETPLISCIVYANLDAATFNVGDCFKLTWPDYQISDMVMRVTGIAYGDGKSNRVRLTCLQDVFEMPTVAFIAPTPPDGIPDTTPAQDLEYVLAYELPYLEALQQMGKSAVDTLVNSNPSAALVGAAGPIPQNNAIEAQLWVNDGGSYAHKGYANFCPFALTDGVLTKLATTINISDSVGTPVDGSWLQIDDELMEVVSLVGNLLTIRRGLLDTVPAEHADNALIFFWDDSGTRATTQYSSGDTLNVKLLTVTGDSVSALADAPEDTILLVGRLARPYPPGQFKINASYFPDTIAGTDDIALTWVHRNRLTQNVKPYVGFTDVTAVPEGGTTYNVRIYDENNALIHTEAGIVTNSYTYTAAQEIIDNGGVNGDQYWSNVVALLHMNASFLDETGKTWSTSTGTPTISGSTFKFGAGAGSFNGSSAIVASASSDWAFGTGDFTVECWVYINVAIGSWEAICGNFDNATNGRWSLWRQNTGQLIFSVHPGLAVNTGATTVPSNQWVHVAASRNGSTIRVYINGVNSGGNASYGAVNVSQTTGIRIGGNFVGTDFFNGFIDDLRITKGIARYGSSSFTPPNAEYYANLPTARVNGKVTVELESVRSSLASYQFHTHTLERTGYGFNYGDRYGS